MKVVIGSIGLLRIRNGSGQYRITILSNGLDYNGEFDPGSGLTLAAGLIHASCTASGVAIHAGE